MTKKPAEWESLTARDIMRTEIFTVSVDTPLSEVERLLSEYRIGGLPVTTENGRIVGVISMRDLLERYAQDSDGSSRRRQTGFYYPASDEDAEDIEEFMVPEETADTAGDIMTPHVYTVAANASLREVSAKMVEHEVHRILVTENNRKIGFISSIDILKALAL
jgi:CBS domain-containing protein